MLKKDGFTLIEILVYIGLFTIIVGGLLLVTYGMIEGSGRIQGDVVINEEGTFILRKMYWALTGASGITVPSAGRLEINNPNFPAGENPLVFEFGSGDVTLSRGAGGALQLNSDNAEISALVFTKISGSGGAPDGVRAQFTLTNVSRSKAFDATRYLKY